jgi:hypothetical protein
MYSLVTQVVVCNIKSLSVYRLQGSPHRDLLLYLYTIFVIVSEHAGWIKHSSCGASKSRRIHSLVSQQFREISGVPGASSQGTEFLYSETLIHHFCWRSWKRMMDVGKWYLWGLSKIRFAQGRLKLNDGSGKMIWSGTIDRGFTVAVLSREQYRTHNKQKELTCQRVMDTITTALNYSNSTGVLGFSLLIHPLI